MSFRFREFQVYKDTKDWIADVYNLTNKIKSKKYFELANQIERAALSVLLNIAEGSDRGSDRDFHRFINISLGSLSEVVAAFDLSNHLAIINSTDLKRIMDKTDSLGRQLGAFKKHLKSSI